MPTATVAPQRRQTARHLRRLGNLAFASFKHPRQRERGQDYLRGLIAQPGRRTVTGVAEAACCCKQSLQHFITDSTWEVEPVMKALALATQRAVGRGQALIIDDTGQAKQGSRSPGVQRQYSGTLGKIGNCQVAVSLDHAGSRGPWPVNWRLFMPTAWEHSHVRRAARVPRDLGHVPKQQLALQMTQQALAWGLKPLPVLADAAYGNDHAFRRGLEAQGLDYMADVDAGLVAHPEWVRPQTIMKAGGGRGRPPLPRLRQRPRTLASLARGHALRRVEGLRGSYLALRVRPAGRGVSPDADGQLKACWLVVWKRSDGTRKHLLSNLPEDASLKALARLASLRWRIERDYRELKQCVGLAHFQGRTLLGWQRHATLCGLAHLLLLWRLLESSESSIYKALSALRPLIIALIGRCPTCGHSPPGHGPAGGGVDEAGVLTK